MKDLTLNFEQLLRYFFSGVITFAAWQIGNGREDTDIVYFFTRGATSLSLGIALALVVGTLVYSLHRALFFPIIHRILLRFCSPPSSSTPWFWSFVTECESNFYIKYWNLETTHKYANAPMHEWAATIHFLYCSGWGILFVSFYHWLNTASKYLPHLFVTSALVLSLALFHNYRFILFLRYMILKQTMIPERNQEEQMKAVRNISLAFTGGAIGAFVGSFNIWFMGKAGISDYIGITMKPEFSSPWVYNRMIWGGIWMLLLLIPIFKNRIFFRGMLFSLAPSAMMLFMVLPSMGKGILGLEFGMLMPVVVIALNFIYGIVASYWYTAGNR